MKKFIMLSMLFCGSAYSMEVDTKDQQLKKLEIAIQLMSLAKARHFTTRCPDCGLTGSYQNRDVYSCKECGKQHGFNDFDNKIQERAAQTIAALQGVLAPVKK